MRSLIWLVLIFTVAVVSATVLGRNDALVSVFYDQWRLDLSLNLFLLLLLGAVLLTFAALQAASGLLSLPGRAREWRLLKRERAAHAALREAWRELLAARYARAQRAAQRALELQADVPELKGDVGFSVLAQMAAASGQHRLQDRRGRDERVRQALTMARDRNLPGAAADGVQLLAAEWALDDRDATRSLALLGELPPGVARRTQALRLRLQAARMKRQPLMALQTARLLAKHQGFSAEAARSLLRSLAIEALETGYDLQQLQHVWQALDASERADAWVLARAARRACDLGHPEQGRQWLQPAWDQIARLEPDARKELSLALVTCAAGAGTDWLNCVETALARHGHEAPLVAAAGAVFAERQLWGKARRPLEQTAAADELPARVRRDALRRLAQLAREQDDEATAARHEQRAAGLD
ncbi:heme biosynthesis protein HemY [Ideonella sp. 4Y16]|uniref:heme biosynthesis HemY N-terminal domain-containing protein n=1 Tax=Ideonella alba TaxID=2824118 RepID=UPI001B366692|nr:heme biosynthesis HemY N-terminal domain-containing protein [Ideonella alba]MBQ0942197.1 heme biosynthesis protein HemY [Ideonella alba]